MKKQNNRRPETPFSAAIAILALLFAATGCKMVSGLIASGTGNNGFSASNSAPDPKDQTNRDANAFVGTWRPSPDSRLKDQFESVVINADGTYKVTGKHDRVESGTYTVSGGRLTFGGAFGEESKKNGVDNITIEGDRMKWSGSGEGTYYFDRVMPGDKSSAREDALPSASPQMPSSPQTPFPPSSQMPGSTAPPPPSAQTDSRASGSSGGIISAGVLNGKAVSLPVPAYPATAKAVHASGQVIVQVTVDENGDVVSATAENGHPLLRQAAESAARQAKFNPPVSGGKPVKLSGTITYDFQSQ